MRKWFRDHWQDIPIITALVLLAVALFINPSGFQNLAWYGLVALTALYAWATMRIVIQNRRTIEEMRQSRLDAVKPALSLQPEIFKFGGSFSALYLMNSGGVAKDVRIDIEVTNPDSKKVLFVPAIDKGNKVFLDVGGKVQDVGGLIKVHVNFNDSYNQNLSEFLSINFSELKKEVREVRGQYSELGEIHMELERITRALEQMSRRFM